MTARDMFSSLLVSYFVLFIVKYIICYSTDSQC